MQLISMGAKCLRGLPVLLLLTSLVFADVPSGPPVGQPVKPFSVESVVGESAGQSVNFTESRTRKPTIYAFVPQEKWSRPCARFLKKLDQEIAAISEAHVVAIWLTSDQTATREYLPRAQQSLKFERTTLAVFPDGSGGPAEWGINTDADISIVVVKDDQVVTTFGFVSVNETVVESVVKTLQ